MRQNMAENAELFNEIRHELTAAQHQSLGPLVNQLGQLQRQLQWFIDYVAAEAKLPRPENGWNLKMDPATGLPYLSGMVPKEKDKT
jgi:hypothetical protein